MTMDSSTIKKETFTLKDDQGKNVDAFVKYDGGRAILKPTGLKAKTSYIATISKNVKSVSGDSLQNDYVWSFTTVAQAQ